MRGSMLLLASCYLLVQVHLSSGQCPSGYQNIGGRCLYFSTSVKQQGDAQTDCQSRGGSLFTPDGASLQSQVSYQIQQLAGANPPPALYTWISLRETNSNRFVWSKNNEGLPIFRRCFEKPADLPRYGLYELSSPKTSTATECNQACMVWLKDFIKTGVSATTVESCNPQAGDCSVGYKMKCYCGQSRTSSPTTPGTCDTRCPSNSENCGGFNAVALRGFQPEGNWALTQTVIGEGNQLCAALGYGTEFYWITKACFTRMRYICQVDAAADRTCPAGYLTFVSGTTDNVICYKTADNSEGVNWFQADALCRSRGAYLIIPPTDDQFRFDIIKDGAYTGNVPGVAFDYWIGAGSSKLTLPNGQGPSYMNFALNQPDVTKGNCIAMSSRSTPSFQWDSRQCNQLYSFICETATMFPTTTTSTTTTTTTTTTAPTTQTTTTKPTLKPTTTIPTPPFSSATVPIAPPTTPTPPKTTTTTTTTTPRPTTTPTTKAPVPTTKTPVGIPSSTAGPGTTPSKPGTTPSKPGTTPSPVGTTPSKPSPTKSSTTKDKGTTPGDNVLQPQASSSLELTLGTKVVIGIVAGVVFISLIIMIVFICQRRRKETLGRLGLEDRQSKQDAYLESYYNAGFNDKERAQDVNDDDQGDDEDVESASNGEDNNDLYQNGSALYAY